MKFDLTDKIIIITVWSGFVVAALFVLALSETLMIGGITGGIAGLIYGMYYAIRRRKKQR